MLSSTPEGCERMYHQTPKVPLSVDVLDDQKELVRIVACMVTCMVTVCAHVGHIFMYVSHVHAHAYVCVPVGACACTDTCRHSTVDVRHACTNWRAHGHVHTHTNVHTMHMLMYGHVPGRSSSAS